MFHAVIGAIIAVVLVFIERKFISKQDMKNQDYIRVALLGFIVSYISAMFISNNSPIDIGSDDIMIGKSPF